MSGVTVTYDAKGLEKLREAAMDAIADLAEFGLEESNRIVPIEEGTLARSGTVSVDRASGVAQVSYDTPYAIVQHEDTQLRHDQGRQAKFLEDAMLTRVAPEAERFIAERIKRATS